MEIHKDPLPSHQSCSPLGEEEPEWRMGWRLSAHRWRGGTPRPPPGGSCPRSPTRFSCLGRKARLPSPSALHSGLPGTICNLVDHAPSHGSGQASNKVAQRMLFVLKAQPQLVCTHRSSHCRCGISKRPAQGHGAPASCFCQVAVRASVRSPVVRAAPPEPRGPKWPKWRALCRTARACRPLAASSAERPAHTILVDPQSKTVRWGQLLWTLGLREAAQLVGAELGLEPGPPALKATLQTPSASLMLSGGPGATPPTSDI